MVALSFTDLVAVAALVLVSNGAVWAVTASQVRGIDEKLSALSARVTTLENLGPQRIRDQITAMRDDLRKTSDAVEALEKRLVDFDGGTWKSSDANWDCLVSALTGCLSLIQSRLDWHLGWLQRVSDPRPGEKIRPGDLVHAEAKLQTPFSRHLHELELCSPNDATIKVSAIALSGGVGDANSLGRLRDLAQERKDLEPYWKLLAARLDDGTL